MRGDSLQFFSSFLPLFTNAPPDLLLPLLSSLSPPSSSPLLLFHVSSPSTLSLPLSFPLNSPVTDTVVARDAFVGENERTFLVGLPLTAPPLPPLLSFICCCASLSSLTIFFNVNQHTGKEPRGALFLKKSCEKKAKKRQIKKMSSTRCFSGCGMNDEEVSLTFR